MSGEILGEVETREAWVPSDKDMSELINAATLEGERGYGKVGITVLRMYNEYLAHFKKDDSPSGYGIFVCYVIGKAIGEWVKQTDEKGDARFDAGSLARGAASLWYRVGTQGGGAPVEDGPWEEAPALDFFRKLELGR